MQPLTPASDSRITSRIAVAVAIAAAAFPSLLAKNVSPSATFYNQALAFGLWAAFVIVAAPAWPRRGAEALWAALAVLCAATLWSWLHGALPASLALSVIGSLAAAAVVAGGGAAARISGRPEDWFAAFCWGWLVAGVLNLLLSWVQVFAPDWCDGEWLAASSYPGRAVGNLRQPNHLSSLLLWSCIAVIGLLDLGRLGRHARKIAAVLLALFVWAVVLTASRTGLVSVLLLACWGVLDRRLSRQARLLLLAAPLVYAVAWLGMAQWASLSQHSFGGTERLAETDISSSRFAIWRDTLTLIRQQPWTGVGMGEFNFAWSMTELPTRPVAFFDHTHNLPLQLAVEMGLPLACLVLGLFGWALWRGASNAWTAPAGASVAQRCAMLMVVMVGLHSLLEYPLWYSYFLLPAAWAWGFALQGEPEPQTAAPTPSHALSAAALAVAAVAAFSVIDYLRVAAIFSAEDGSPSLQARIASGQRSVFFAHHADYAAVTSIAPEATAPHAFARATHYLLDSRLMMAWARARAAQGDIDGARYIAARLREFRKEDAVEFFAACPKAAVPAAPGLPFQCELPQGKFTWRDFLNR